MCFKSIITMIGTPTVVTLNVATNWKQCNHVTGPARALYLFRGGEEEKWRL